MVVADVEGVELKVCSNCSEYGRVKKELTQAHLPAPGHPLSSHHDQTNLSSPYHFHSRHPGLPTTHPQAGQAHARLSDPNHPPMASAMGRRERVEFKVVDDYPSLIRSARERKGMKQEDFAKLLNERESLVAKWEGGSLKPRLDVAKKVGRVLGISLIEEDLEVAAKVESQGKAEIPTLGDFVKVRKRG